MKPTATVQGNELRYIITRKRSEQEMKGNQQKKIPKKVVWLTDDSVYQWFVALPRTCNRAT